MPYIEAVMIAQRNVLARDSVTKQGVDLASKCFEESRKEWSSIQCGELHNMCVHISISFIPYPFGISVKKTYTRTTGECKPP